MEYLWKTEIKNDNIHQTISKTLRKIRKSNFETIKEEESEPSSVEGNTNSVNDMTEQELRKEICDEERVEEKEKNANVIDSIDYINKLRIERSNEKARKQKLKKQKNRRNERKSKKMTEQTDETSNDGSSHENNSTDRIEKNKRIILNKKNLKNELSILTKFDNINEPYHIVTTPGKNLSNAVEMLELYKKKRNSFWSNSKSKSPGSQFQRFKNEKYLSYKGVKGRSYKEKSSSWKKKKTSTPRRNSLLQMKMGVKYK